MAAEFDPALYVLQAAATLGLEIAPEDFREVVAAFSVLARVAGPVMATPLPEELVAAAVFAPLEGDAP